MRITGISIVACFLAGCQSGFDRNAVSARLQDESFEVSDKEIHDVLSLKPQLAFPCKIAVYLDDADYQDHWTAEDKAFLRSWGEQLIREGVATDVFFMSEMFLPAERGLRDLRLGAARHGADALLVIRGASQVDEYLNPAAIFNLTVVGGFVIPASHRDALYVLQAGLVDVGNGFLYSGVEVDGEGGVVRPTFLIEERDAIRRARQDALTKLAPELYERLRHLQRTGPRGLSVSRGSSAEE